MSEPAKQGPGGHLATIYQGKQFIQGNLIAAQSTLLNRTDPMRISAVNRIDVTAANDDLPDVVRQSATPTQAIFLVALSAGAMAVLLLPLVLIAAHAADNPHALDLMIERPGSMLLLSAGLAITLALSLFLLRAGLARFSRRRTVRFTRGMVAVEDTNLLGKRRWQAPLSQFSGVTHHIRATLSGSRHEIILMHPDRSKDLLLHLDTRAPQQGADHYARLLGLNEVHAKALYERRVPASPMAKAA